MSNRTHCSDNQFIRSKSSVRRTKHKNKRSQLFVNLTIYVLTEQSWLWQQLDSSPINLFLGYPQNNIQFQSNNLILIFQSMTNKHNCFTWNEGHLFEQCTQSELGAGGLLKTNGHRKTPQTSKRNLPASTKYSRLKTSPSQMSRTNRVHFSIFACIEGCKLCLGC